MLPEVKKILYATDLSDSAKPAFFWAMSLAEQYNATISILHVIPDIMEIMSGSMGYDLSVHFEPLLLEKYNDEGQDAAMDSAKKRVKNVCGEMKQDIPDCRVDHHNIIIKTGDTVQKIIDESVDYDVVVMGTHGHGAIERFLLGSVARGVVNKCTTPVLTIRVPAQ